MQQPFFSDRDIEDYLDGVFEGDVTAIQAYLENTLEGQQKLAHYKALYAALHEEEQPMLPVSLSDAVLDKLASRNTKPGFQWNSILWIAGGIAAAALVVYCFLLLQDFSLTTITTNYIPFIIIIAIVLVAFQWTDIRHMKKRYKLNVSI